MSKCPIEKRSQWDICPKQKRSQWDKRRNMNTKQKRNLFIYITMLLIIIILLAIFAIYCIQKNYKESLYDYTNQVMAKIVEEYPEQEEEIVQNIFLNNQENQENHENVEDILSKYGFSAENIDIENMQFEIIQKVIILFSIFFIMDKFVCISVVSLHINCHIKRKSSFYPIRKNYCYN